VLDVAYGDGDGDRAGAELVIATVIICAAAPTKNNPMIVRKLHMLCLVMHRPKKLQ